MPARPPFRIFAVSAALISALLASGCGRTDAAAGPGNDPVQAVRDFLNDGVVDHNGYEACVYMTFRQQRAAARRDSSGQCRGAFDLASLKLGDQTVDTVHEVETLAASSSVHRGSARVRLSRGGRSAVFELVPASFAETEQFLAPETNWRIARGDLLLVPHQEG